VLRLSIKLVKFGDWPLVDFRGTIRKPKTISCGKVSRISFTDVEDDEKDTKVRKI